MKLFLGVTVGTMISINDALFVGAEAQPTVVGSEERSEEMGLDEVPEVSTIDSQRSEKETTKTGKGMANKKKTSATTEGKEEPSPQLIGVMNQTIELNRSFDPKEGIIAKDKRDGDLTKKIVIKGSVDTKKAERYPLTYSVKNTAGKETKEHAQIHVKEVGASIPTYRIELSDFTVRKQSQFEQEIHERMLIKDEEGQVLSTKGMTVTVEGEKQATQLGTFPVKFSVKLLDGTVLKKTITITVKSGIRVVTPKEDYVFDGKLDDYSLNLMDYIEAYEISSDGQEKRLAVYDPEKKTGIEVVRTTINISKPGRYFTEYYIVNALGEEVLHSSHVVVKEQYVVPDPTVTADDQRMYVGDRLTDEMILSWATATNATSLSFEVLNGPLPIHSETQQLEEAGTYTIQYCAMRPHELNDSMFGSETTITLTVKEKERKTIRTEPIQPTSETPVVTTKKTFVTKPTAQVTKAKSLPKTGSEKASVSLIIAGFLLVDVALFVALKKVRMKRTGE